MTSAKQTTNKGQKKGKAPPHAWKPGQSGNPKGRPKRELCITTQLRDVLGEVPEVLPDFSPNTDKKTWARILAEQMVQGACKNLPAALKEVVDRVEGRVAQQLNLGGPDGEPLSINIGVMTRDEHKRLINAQARAILAEQGEGSSV